MRVFLYVMSFVMVLSSLRCISSSAFQFKAQYEGDKGGIEREVDRTKDKDVLMQDDLRTQRLQFLRLRRRHCTL